MYTPNEIMDITISYGVKKIEKPFLTKVILGFIGGAMIALGYLAYVRVSASIPANLASIQSLVGASVFPIGLIIILLAGGELVTGNMMAVSAAWIAKKVTFKEVIINLLTITSANIFGAVFVAFFFGHVVGLTASGVFLEQVVSLAHHKVEASWVQAIISGIGCNWFVGIALWLCYGAKDSAGKMIGIWFPVMAFVAIGFQHSIANSFIISAALFEGSGQWSDFFRNFLFVYIGNGIGGSVFVSGFYYLSYKYGHSEGKPAFAERYRKVVEIEKD